ncbi:MAG: hypothetical protein AAGA77_04645 [Bacteroidota bacterium]
METLEEKFKNMHLLDRGERIKLTNELNIQKPEFLGPYVPNWWWWRRCRVNVLIACDGGLNFGIGGFDLSEFLTTFNELEARSWVDYRVTLAHRGAIINSANPVVVNHISGFNFDTSVNLDDFDQVWLFGIQSGGSISNAEINAIEAYMDGGGGLFATGDHGSLGRAMCGNIPRVSEMRYWDNTPVGSTNATNEVSMNGRRRNDTNTPRPGNATATTFDHQSDDYPQQIAVRTFGGGLPHPLLSIKTSVRPSGIIDIMPDHPHEGECASETSFTVNGVTIPTQIIATSFVNGGNISGSKSPTDPHCFPSISVWDGRPANVGRIVIDSTWHHFVNINLNGAGSAQSGLTNPDWEVIRQYFMNIATWMNRRRFFLCLRPYLVYELLRDSQIIEASLNNPGESIEDISIADLNSIGSLAEEILAEKFTPCFARYFLLDTIEEYSKEYCEMMNCWAPEINEKSEQKEKADDYYTGWLNLDLVLHTAIGAGFIALRDNKKMSTDDASEKDLEMVSETFLSGIKLGFNKSLDNLNNKFNGFAKTMRM